MNNWCICWFFMYMLKMHGSRSKIPSKKSRPYIHISRLRFNLKLVLLLSEFLFLCVLCQKKKLPYYPCSVLLDKLRYIYIYIYSHASVYTDSISEVYGGPKKELVK